MIESRSLSTRFDLGLTTSNYELAGLFISISALLDTPYLKGSDIVIQSDCKFVINKLHESHPKVPEFMKLLFWKVRSLFHDLRMVCISSHHFQNKYVQVSNSCVLHYISREKNVVADQLSSNARLGNFTDQNPFDVQDIAKAQMYLTYPENRFGAKLNKGKGIVIFIFWLFIDLFKLAVQTLQNDAVLNSGNNFFFRLGEPFVFVSVIFCWNKLCAIHQKCNKADLPSF